MVDLDGTSVETLRKKLRETDEKTPALRLVVALNYKYGLSQTEIADQYGIARKTVYNWLVRFQSRPIEEALHDRDRSGRPSKLTGEQRRLFYAQLRRSPKAVGYDADAWNPSLARRLVRDVFDVDYSIPHLRRLLREAGLVPGEDGWVGPE
ncbi:helix-turn-helix domain-containing protein [Halomarina oriensis]|uniref:Helix-turn-helix domain-containing protein n=1 Tax=Halomarina oriensis TaxID=671145 RepID=A0A6B0GFH4_9EURY|nr:helix-turn-helix domain-containing protein [Halomarina oriensis]MWG33454.1 helix-turn-helix domain-containing protein [Halomarina oriensis]